MQIAQTCCSAGPVLSKPVEALLKLKLQHDCLQVLYHLHGALQSVALDDPLLRVSVGLRLALHLEAAADPAAAATVLKQVSRADKL